MGKAKTERKHMSDQQEDIDVTQLPLDEPPEDGDDSLQGEDDE